MMRQAERGRLPRAGSAVLRGVLAGLAMLVLVSIPENIRTWDDPGASVLPSERTMPEGGNYAVAVIMAASAIALIWGWFARRSHRRLGVAPRVLAAITVAGQSLWAVVLVVSQVRAFAHTGGTGYGGGIYLDGVAAAIAVATITIVARDLLAAASIASLTPDTELSST